MKTQIINKKNVGLILLILILILAFYIRIHNTNELSGGDDSQFAELAMFAHQNLYYLFYPSFPDEPVSFRGKHYARFVAILPLYISIGIFGYTKYAVAIPSILFACGSIFLVFLIVQKHLGNRVALLSSLLLALSPFHIAFTRSGFLHSQLLFIDLLIFYCVFKYFEKNESFFIYLSGLFLLFDLFLYCYNMIYNNL